MYYPNIVKLLGTEQMVVGNVHVDETKLKQQQLIYFQMHFYLQFVFEMDMLCKFRQHVILRGAMFTFKTFLQHWVFVLVLMCLVV